MSTQILVNVVSATVPGGSVNYAVPHGLRSNDKAVAPTLILPASQSVVVVSSADAENVYLSNPSGGDVTVTLRCERGLSNELDAETITPFFQSVGTGEVPPAPVQSVGVAAPIVNTGTASNPVIGATVGTTAGTLCAGDDARLSNTRSPTPLSPSPAGTYGSSSAIPVVTVNSAGQVTGVTTQPATGGGVAAVSVTAPIVNTGTATNPNIGASVGSTAGTMCAGNDPRLLDSRTIFSATVPTAGATGTVSNTNPFPFFTFTTTPVFPITGVISNGKVLIYQMRPSFTPFGLLTNPTTGWMKAIFSISSAGGWYWGVMIPPNGGMAFIPESTFVIVNGGPAGSTLLLNSPPSLSLSVTSLTPGVSPYGVTYDFSGYTLTLRQ